jgi:hypothetical protein
MRLLHLPDIYTFLFAASVYLKRNFSVTTGIYPQFSSLFMDSKGIKKSYNRKTFRRMENDHARKIAGLIFGK